MRVRLYLPAMAFALLTCSETAQTDEPSRDEIAAILQNGSSGEAWYCEPDTDDIQTVLWFTPRKQASGQTALAFEFNRFRIGPARMLLLKQPGYVQFRPSGELAFHVPDGRGGFRELMRVRIALSGRNSFTMTHTDTAVANTCTRRFSPTM